MPRFTSLLMLSNECVYVYVRACVRARACVRMCNICSCVFDPDWNKTVVFHTISLHNVGYTNRKPITCRLLKTICRKITTVDEERKVRSSFNSATHRQRHSQTAPLTDSATHSQTCRVFRSSLNSATHSQTCRVFSAHSVDWTSSNSSPSLDLHDACSHYAEEVYSTTLRLGI